MQQKQQLFVQVTPKIRLEDRTTKLVQHHSQDKNESTCYYGN